MADQRVGAGVDRYAQVAAADSVSGHSGARKIRCV